MTSDAKISLVAALRAQIDSRINYQHQLLAVAAAIAGAAATFGAKDLARHPELLALLAMLFVGFALALLRHEQEITIITAHLVDEAAFGDDAEAERRWERYRLGILQPTSLLGALVSASLVIGIYGVPVLAAIAFGWAAVAERPNGLLALPANC